MKKLLIITGAGASLEFGMPSVKQIDKLFEDWALEILPLKEDNQKSLYSWLKERLNNYASQNSKNRLSTIVNFESLLYAIQNLYSLSSDVESKRYNNLINSFIDLQSFPKVLRFEKEKRADAFDFLYLHSYLVDKLLEFIRAQCQSISYTKKTELELATNFFNTLKKEFHLGFINLNYDNVILESLPDLSTGFSKVTGDFDRSEIYNSNWNFCYHLHGSVHFDMIGEKNYAEMHKISWNKDLSASFCGNSSGRNGNNTSEGLNHLQSNIIAGLDKTNQLLREPFGPYYMQLDKLVFEADSILFIGYGFNDLHLNKALSFIRYDESKKRKVAVIDFASNGEDALHYRHDSWSGGIFQAVPFNAPEMGNGKNNLPQSVSYFRKNKTLEKSSNPNYPLAIWYNGFLEACKNVKRIMKEL